MPPVQSCVPPIISPIPLSSKHDLRFRPPSQASRARFDGHGRNCNTLSVANCECSDFKTAHYQVNHVERLIPAAFKKCQAAGSIAFCADEGSTDKTRTRRRFV